MISEQQAQEFLSVGHRIAVVGASGEKGQFGGTIFRELRQRGFDAVPVNPSTTSIDEAPCYPDVGAVPGDVDVALVMVHRDRAADVVRQCIARGVPRVWLFKGFGGAGSVSPEAVDLCRSNGVEVVEGACPLMFLTPTGAHRFHRTLRRWNRSLVAAS